MNEKQTRKSTIQETINCRYFPKCSGCKKQTDLFNNDKHLKLERDLKLKIPFIVDTIIDWRHRVKLAVGGSSLYPLIGLYKEQSHDIIHIEDCPLHTSGINLILGNIVESIKKTKLSIYSEETFQGILRYIQVIENVQDHNFGVTLVVNEDLDKAIEHKFFDDFIERCQEKVISLWLNEKKTKDNIIFGSKWKLVHGSAYTSQQIFNKTFYFHPATFCQVHIPQYEKVIYQIRSWIKKGSFVLELYAGIGTIGINISDIASNVFCYENNPYAKECFDKSYKFLQDDKVKFFQLKSEDFAVNSYDICILDPPRKGISNKVLEKITSISSIKEIIALYCDSESFVRDVKEFEKKGFILEEVKSYLFFPGSNHIEVLGRLKKSE